MAINDITGDEIKSRVNSPAYDTNFEVIFGKKEKVRMKKECFDCVTYNSQATEQYCCAVKGSCPGLEKEKTHG